MCRIAGLVNPAMPVEGIEAMVEDMCLIQKHGGPDDGGTYTDADSHVVLGNRRLALIDLSPAGHQPMGYENGRYQLTYNGELYNYTELKDMLLKAGCTFTSGSDTEVVLAAFAAWGTAAFEKFNGMFAFALWDKATSNIYLVRDAAGIKPLYFAQTKEGLAFASEVRAFKNIPYLQTPHPSWQVYLMAYGHLPEPITTLKEVVPLKKGSYLQYNVAAQTSEQKAFTHYSFIEQIDGREAAIALVQETLAAAVKRHLLADAPIGVFLSGGLDSSIIAQLAHKENPGINTVSLFFDDKEYSEKQYQDIVQKGLGGNQYQQLLQEADFHTQLPEIIKAMDLPGCDGINTWFISKYAKERGLKAVLSGIGGDELFGGYPSFNRIQKALLVQQIPDLLLKAGRYSNFKSLRRLCYLSIDGPAGMYLFLRGQFIPNEVAEYLNADETEVWKLLEEQPVLGPIANLTPKNQASWIETNLYMQNQLLRDADVMGMAHGVEIRVPFLDAAFLKLAHQLSSEVKYSGAFKKQLLIDSFKDILPEPVWNRPKMGFAFPFKEWLAKDQYAGSRAGSKNAGYHKRFVDGKLHWSQFLTIFLMESHSNA